MRLESSTTQSRRDFIAGVLGAATVTLGVQNAFAVGALGNRKLNDKENQELSGLESKLMKREQAAVPAAKGKASKANAAPAPAQPKAPAPVAENPASLKRRAMQACKDGDALKKHYRDGGKGACVKDVVSGVFKVLE
ncbi:unnamed protein product [Phaeothamnion confervicola]